MSYNPWWLKLLQNFFENFKEVVFAICSVHFTILVGDKVFQLLELMVSSANNCWQMVMVMMVMVMMVMVMVMKNASNGDDLYLDGDDGI